MSIELLAHNELCFGLNIANKTFLTMINKSGIKSILGDDNECYTGIVVNHEQALKCAEALELWSPDHGWAYNKSIIIDFFEESEGFIIV